MQENQKFKTMNLTRQLFDSLCSMHFELEKTIINVNAIPRNLNDSVDGNEIRRMAYDLGHFLSDIQGTLGSLKSLVKKLGNQKNLNDDGWIRF